MIKLVVFYSKEPSFQTQEREPTLCLGAELASYDEVKVKKFICGNERKIEIKVHAYFSFHIFFDLSKNS